MKPVVYSRDAIRTLSRLPTNVASLIRQKVALYAADPAALAGNVKALKGDHAGRIRLRVGDWRVIMTETCEVLSVQRVAPRGSANV